MSKHLAIYLPTYPIYTDLDVSVSGTKTDEEDVDDEVGRWIGR